MKGEKKQKNANEDPVDRRDFMGAATAAIGGLIGIGLAAPAVAYVIGPAITSGEETNWIQLGSVTKVEIGIPTLFKAKIERKAGWIVNEEEISVYVLTDDGREFVAMSNICTHLGCRVRWISDQEKFFCPCHNAVFNKNGSVDSGPPPRPLDQYEVKVENGQLFILGG